MRKNYFFISTRLAIIENFVVSGNLCNFVTLVLKLYNTMVRIIYIIESVLLLLCLADMPYGFYQLVRFVSMCVFGFLASVYYQEKRSNLVFIFVGLALLFQPFIKIALGRVVWNAVDVATALMLIVLLIQDLRKKQL